jgi:uncharacterized membrane protein (UPF0127 family)
MRFGLVASSLPLCLIACSEKPAYSGDERILPFDSADVRIASDRDTVIVRAELALSSEQKTLGLMERRSLSENAGMLFVYDSTQAPDAGFWMYRTRIPLDIAFMDSAGVIRAILTMLPCETTIPQGCATYPPNVPYRYALEVNAGFFQAQAIAVGDILLLDNLPPRPKSRAVP